MKTNIEYTPVKPSEIVNFLIMLIVMAILTFFMLMLIFGKSLNFILNDGIILFLLSVAGPLLVFIYNKNGTLTITEIENIDEVRGLIEKKLKRRNLIPLKETEKGIVYTGKTKIQTFFMKLGNDYFICKYETNEVVIYAKRNYLVNFNGEIKRMAGLI